MNLWDEKNLTDLGKNFSHNNGFAQNGTMTDIKIDCEKIECNDTGLTRTCPKCGGTIVYATKYSRLYADRDRRICKRCVMEDRRRNNIGKRRTPEQCERIAKSHTGWKHTPEYKDGMRRKNTGRRMSTDFCDKMRSRMLGNRNSAGRPKSAEWRRKLIDKMAKAFSNTENVGKSFLPNYNEMACEYFNWLNMWNGWDGQHALYKGEKNVLSYFVDYYEPTLNIVVEWDEPHHKRQHAKDVLRQEEIKKQLRCRFFRYNVLTRTMIEV